MTKTAILVLHPNLLEDDSPAGPEIRDLCRRLVEKGEAVLSEKIDELDAGFIDAQTKEFLGYLSEIREPKKP